MAIGKASDFKVHDDHFDAGIYEVLAQNVAVFNEASGNAIRLVADNKLGNYDTEALFQVPDGAVTRRDITSTSAVEDLPLTEAEERRVKVNRKYGPIANTIDAFRKVGKGSEELSLVLGRAFARHQMRDWLNTAAIALEAAIRVNTTLVATVTSASTKTMTHGHLVTGMSKLGDAGTNIRAWLMHSKVYYDLMQQTISDKIAGVANLTIYAGTAQTLGRPVIVTDIPSLYDVGTSASDDQVYITLGLTEGACTVNQSEERTMVSEVVTGLENLVVRTQGEYAFNIGIKGMAYQTGGGINPTNTTLANTSYWAKVAQDVKNTAGVAIISQ